MSVWHSAVTRAPDGSTARSVADMLAWFDDARVIVAYNGRAFDMHVLRGYYGGDAERWEAHLAKLHDPMAAVQRAVGRRVRLATLLRLNGLGAKAGTGCDAPAWWAVGRLQQLEQYCMRDTRALADVVLRRELRVSSSDVTRDASVAALIERGATHATAADAPSWHAAYAASNICEPHS